MILTTCAACAAPLAHTAPRCIRCKMRYCDQTCQHTLDDLREAVKLLEDLASTTRRVLGGANPLTSGIEAELRAARAALRAREAGKSVVFVECN